MSSDPSYPNWLYWLVLLLVAVHVVTGLTSCSARGDELTRWGTPEGTVVVDVPGHACGAYDGRSKNPRWKLGRLTPASVKGNAVRRKVFREDARIPKELRAKLADYAGSSEFDRGHELAAEFFGRQADRDLSFLLSNMSPQNKRLNEVDLNALEQWVVHQVLAGRTAWYLSADCYGQRELPQAKASGARLEARGAEREFMVRTVGPNHVWVPSAYVKSVLFLDAGEKLPAAASGAHIGKSERREGRKGPSETITLHTFILPNETPPASASFWDFATTTDAGEILAGLDLWAELPDGLEEKLEAAK